MEVESLGRAAPSSGVLTVSRHPEFWRLPGGRRFVQRLLATSRDLPVMVVEPLAPTLLAAALEHAVREEGLDTCLHIDGADGTGRSLAERLKAASGAQATTPEGFALQLRYAVLIVSGVGPSDDLGGQAADFVRAAAARTDDATPRVVAVGAAPDKRWSAPAWRLETAEGVLNHLDTASFAAQAVGTEDTLSARLAISVAIEVGAWDLEIVERLQSLPDLCAIRPDLHTDRWIDDRSREWSGHTTTAWQAGTSDAWAGTVCVHPVFLATNSPALLTRRVWRAHVAVLLPWLEEIRQAVVARYADRLVADPTSYHEDVESLDWGPVCSQLAGEPSGVRDFLHNCRRLRNRLAHGSPASWHEIEACVKGLARWSR